MQESFLDLNKYNTMADDTVLNLAKSGDENALNFIMDKYNNIVNMKASKFFAAGIEKEDIIHIEQFKVMMEKNKIHLKVLQICVLKDSL